MTVESKTYYILISSEQRERLTVGQVVLIDNLNYYDNFISLLVYSYATGTSDTFDVEDANIAGLLKKYRIFPQLISGEIISLEDSYMLVNFKYKDLNLELAHLSVSPDEVVEPVYFKSNKQYNKLLEDQSYQLVGKQLKVSQILDETGKVVTKVLVLDSKLVDRQLYVHSSNIKAGDYVVRMPLNLDGTIGYVATSVDG